MSLAASASEMFSPFTRMRSPKLTRWGEVKSPVLYPAARATDSAKAQVEPLPFVPATWMTRARG